MIAALRAVGRGLRHLNQAGYVYIWCNVAWALLSLLIITAPAAWAGMIRLAWTAQRQPTAGWSDFWQGFKDNFWRGIPIALFNVAFFVMTLSNFGAYAAFDGAPLVILRGFWIGTTVLVIAVQLYMGPLYYALEKPTFGGALRNAAVMILLNPLFTLVVLLSLILIAILSTVLPLAWLLITGGALASITTAAVIDRLRAAGILPPEDPASLMIDPSFSDM